MEVLLGDCYCNYKITFSRTTYVWVWRAHTPVLAYCCVFHITGTNELRMRSDHISLYSRIFGCSNLQTKHMVKSNVTLVSSKLASSSIRSSIQRNGEFRPISAWLGCAQSATDNVVWIAETTTSCLWTHKNVSSSRQIHVGCYISHTDIKYWRRFHIHSFPKRFHIYLQRTEH